MSCTTNNPCYCLCQYVPPSTPCKSPTGCLRLGYLTVKPEDSVAPCNQTGEVSFKCFDFSGCCSSDIRIVVDDNPNPTKLIVNSLTKDKLVFTITDQAQVGERLKLIIKATCCDLGDYAYISIFVKDPCSCVNCESGFVCNNCGDCVPAPVITGDVEFTGTETLVYNENSVIING